MVSFRPSGQDDLAPSGTRARLAANMAAIEVLRTLDRERRAASADEQAALARWSGWGASGLSAIFDDSRADVEVDRVRLRELLGEDGYRAARLTVINAHYTDAAIVQSMWDALGHLGFTGGRVLEPGCGSGTFIGLAPAGVEMTGVELDPTTAAVAAALYPKALIRAESFVDTKALEGFFDAAVGNVPFSKVALYDPRHNPAGHSMHNHFIIKTLWLTRPGGMVAVLTSHHTLDAVGAAARREIAQLADLVGAVRLPSGALRRSAGTDAVTDLLILRRHVPDNAATATSDSGDIDGDVGNAPRREAAAQAESSRWITTTMTSLPGPSGDDEPVTINSYFVDHPDRVLGVPSVQVGMHGVAGLQIDGPLGEALQPPLRAALASIVEEARESGLTWQPATEAQQRAADRWQVAAEGAVDGHIVAHSDGSFRIVDDGLEVPLEVPQTQAKELRDLLQLRDQVHDLLALEASSTGDVPGLEEKRHDLATGWRAYVDRYGPINRFMVTWTTRRSSPRAAAAADDEPTMVENRRRPGAVRLLSRDPWGPTVLALEVFDDDTQQATPASLLKQRQVTARQPVDRVDSPAEAIAVSFDRTGGIDLALIGNLLKIPAADVPARLGDAVFEVPPMEPAELDRPAISITAAVHDASTRADPTGAVSTNPSTETGWVTRAAYLSGNVRDKLAAARLAALAEPQRWQRNITALELVMPVDLGAADVTARLGAVWIPDRDYTDFVRELLDDRRVTVAHFTAAEWRVDGGDYGVKATSEWGTEALPAGKLMERLLRQQRIEVFSTSYDADGRQIRVFNPTLTEAAKEKAELLQQRFTEWVWEDPERTARLLLDYNQRFNSVVLRDYSTEGTHLTLPGLAVESFQPRPHQRAAVARMINEPSVGLFHEVGAGKTAVMAMGATELKRLGLINKPAVVVPNHMLEQFSREWLQLYPRARLLAASSADLTSDARRRFVAKVATNDWDAVIMTRTAFQRLSLTPTNQAAYAERELASMRADLEAANEAGHGRSRTMKQMETKLLNRQEKLRKLLDSPTDPGVNFEESGIDYLVVDELHDYKNLSTPSNIRDAAIGGSERASDLHMKVEYLRSLHGGRAITGATATPIANSITEMWVLQRYLDPAALTAAGLDSFDQWAATFGEVTTDMELGVTGGNTFKIRDRFAHFVNVPELLTMLHRFGDIKTAADLQLPVPDVAPRDDGQRLPSIIKVDPTEQLLNYIKDLGRRADDVATRQVKPTDDNMLKISVDGRKAALDLRLINHRIHLAGDTKIDAAADLLARVYHDTKDNLYLDSAGEPSPVRGALQMVFCDLGVPGEGWNVYEALRGQLLDRGLPPAGVRFVHEAKNDAEKARLFAACRAGHVSVLIGSTTKMGVGTNIQARAIHLVDMDAPWRPADVAQRHGRIVRQGNQNVEVMLSQIVTGSSFDSYMWQALERKATFINQVMTAKLGGARDIDDIGGEALSYAEVKAITSGNPLLLEKAAAERELAKYTRLRTAHNANQRSLRYTITNTTAELATTRAEIPNLTAAAKNVVPTAGDAFHATVAGRDYTERAGANTALSHVLMPGLRHSVYYGGIAPHDYSVIATLGGHHVAAKHDGTTLTFTVPDVPGATALLAVADVGKALAGGGAILRLEHLVARIPSLADKARIREQDLLRRLDQATQALDAPFRHTEALNRAQTRYDNVTREMAATTSQPALDDNNLASERVTGHERVDEAVRRSTIEVSPTITDTSVDCSPAR